MHGPVVNEPVSPKVGRNIWAIALVVLAIALAFNIGRAVVRGEWDDLFWVGLFLIGIPVGIAFWKWQHYRDRRRKFGAFVPLFALQDTVILDRPLDTATTSLVDTAKEVAASSVFGPAFWIFTLGGLAAIIVGWVKRHPDLIDRPDPPGTSRGAWNTHSKYHLLYAAGISFLVAIFDGPTAGIISAILLGLGVELAQKFPRDKGGGTIEFMDIFYDVLGAMLGALVATFIRCGLFSAPWC